MYRIYRTRFILSIIYIYIYIYIYIHYTLNYTIYTLRESIKVNGNLYLLSQRYTIINYILRILSKK